MVLGRPPGFGCSPQPDIPQAPPASPLTSKRPTLYQYCGWWPRPPPPLRPNQPSEVVHPPSPAGTRAVGSRLSQLEGCFSVLPPSRVGNFSAHSRGTSSVPTPLPQSGVAVLAPWARTLPSILPQHWGRLHTLFSVPSSLPEVMTSHYFGLSSVSISAPGTTSPLGPQTAPAPGWTFPLYFQN